MKGVCLKFYAYELQKHKGLPLYEWLLEFAKKNGIKGGSCFRGFAGYGQNGIVHEEHFFELASDVPVEIEFILQEKEIALFLEKLKEEKIDLFYTKLEIEYGRLSTHSN